MKFYTILFLVSTSAYSFGQNVGINTTNPSERLHVQDTSNTKLLLNTNSGTSFFTSDSPTNSGLLFRDSGVDKALFFYSPLSKSLTASIGLNGWTMDSNGDLRVKERVYSLNDLRLDAQESITIEANGALIKIDPDGNIEIQGKSISIAAEDDLNITANNINIDAQSALNVSSGTVSSFTAGTSFEASAMSGISLATNSNFNVNAINLDLAISQATNISSGSEFVLTSNSLSVSTNQNASFSIGSGFAINTGSDLNLTVGSNYNLNVANNYNLGIAQNYDLNALNISAQASATMDLLGTIIRFNNGNTGIAMKGDSVSTPAGTGTIISGSSQVFGN